TRSTAVFSALPPYAIEQVGHGFVHETFEAGAAVMTEGEAGDRICLIAAGCVDVHRDGEIIARRERGSVVGEISLLHEVPRTATLTAGPAGVEVYWMGAGAFLDAVNRVPRSRSRAEAEARRRLDH
ncbi:cyclic nucleotide-binding domain-containing protein, partial [Ilumatobacter sp.]|uniref:cyclic nucleotide-binding domain-containing protein n=1 Tax=Ilumatobacter sp. TaxID=1967498 RepID=UPI003C54752D